MLVVNRYKKYYYDTVILEIDHLALSPGIYWVKGKNGSGKSTLFKSMAGLIPFDGTMQINGADIRKQALQYRGRVNFGEAEPSYPGFVTPKDLVTFIGAAKGASAQQQRMYAEKFGIIEYFEKACDTFSTGMLKKLSLVLAFLGNPQLLILDEPLIGLDEPSRDILLTEIKTLPASTVTLISSHQESDLASLAIKGHFEIRNAQLNEV